MFILLNHLPCSNLGIQEGEVRSKYLYKEGWKKLPPRKDTAETHRRDHPLGHKDLLILTSDDSDNNFSGTPPKMRTELMNHQNTPVMRTV
jgi:hypothetical protein